MEYLKRGYIAVNKKDLIDLLSVIQSVEHNVDKAMKEPESVVRGKSIAKELNRLTFIRQSFEHFQLNIPLNKLK